VADSRLCRASQSFVLGDPEARRRVYATKLVPELLCMHQHVGRDSFTEEVDRPRRRSSLRSRHVTARLCRPDVMRNYDMWAAAGAQNGKVIANPADMASIPDGEVTRLERG
jgi:hypothetical protein